MHGSTGSGRARFGRGWTAALTILLAVLAVRSALADATRARAHYEKGRSYFQVGEYRKALEEFKAAHVEKNDAAYIYNLAECHRLLGERKMR